MYVGAWAPLIGDLALPPNCDYYGYDCTVNPGASVISWIPYLMSLFLLVLLCKARAKIRAKDQIPESCCEGNGPCDDCCCIFFCMPCASCEMMQHVTGGDYELCSETGTPNHAGDLEQGLLPP